MVMGLLSLKILNLKRNNMKRIEITSPQIHGKAHLGIREITGWWSSKKAMISSIKLRKPNLKTLYIL